VKLLTTPLEELVDELGDRVITDPAQTASFSTDSSRARPVGLPAAVVTAAGSADVAAALAWAHRHRVKVSVRGGGTGLTGGAVGYPGGLVISLAAMTKIIGMDPAQPAGRRPGRRDHR
jgi:glycolate oxidase